MMIPFFAAVLVAVFSSAKCGPMFPVEQYITPNDTTQCGNDLVEWCNNMTFPPDSSSVSTVAVTYMDSDEGVCHYFCIADMDAVNCTKNGSPWIACSKDHVFTYKGKPLTKDEEEGSEGEDICKTACRAFNSLHVQNLSYNNSTTGFFDDIFSRSFEQAMKALREQLSWLNNFGDFFSSPTFGDADQNTERSPKEKNDIERE